MHEFYYIVYNVNPLICQLTCNNNAIYHTSFSANTAIPGHSTLDPQRWQTMDLLFFPSSETKSDMISLDWWLFSISNWQTTILNWRACKSPGALAPSTVHPKLVSCAFWSLEESNSSWVDRRLAPISSQQRIESMSLWNLSTEFGNKNTYIFTVTALLYHTNMQNLW